MHFIIQKIKNKLKLIPWNIWILLIIIAFGIFLRTYNFKEWLVFRPDQARDAMLIDEIINEKKSWIIIGPEVGGENYGLGPWFYHLEILSAKIFGNEPWKLAYPDLLFSILSIPLFYFFLRKYFNKKTTLILVFFLTISYFIIRYSRFAFNPNSIPFFVLIYLLGIFYLLKEKNGKKWKGSILTGIGIGVGIQLHIFLLLSMPLTTFLFFLYSFFKEKGAFLIITRKIFIILFFVLLTNTGYIIYEINYNALNTKNFINSLVRKIELNKNKDGLFKKDLRRNFLCHAQSNLHIITSLGNNDFCNFYKISTKPSLKKNFVLLFSGIIYSLGGYILLFYFWRKEKNTHKKNFLMIVGIYSLTTLVIMLPVISQLTLRYYLVTFFLPFIFLGLWMKYIQQKLKGQLKNIALVLIILILIFFHFNKIKEKYDLHKKHIASDKEYTVLGEVEIMMDYIAKNIDPQKEIYLAGKKAYVSRFYKPFLYIGNRDGIKIKKREKIDPHSQIIYLQKNTSAEKINKKKFMGKTAKDYKIFENISIIIYDN